jgi:hypothetical protein
MVAPIDSPISKDFTTTVTYATSQPPDTENQFGFLYSLVGNPTWIVLNVLGVNKAKISGVTPSNLIDNSIISFDFITDVYQNGVFFRKVTDPISLTVVQPHA